MDKFQRNFFDAGIEIPREPTLRQAYRTCAACEGYVHAIRHVCATSGVGWAGARMCANPQRPNSASVLSQVSSALPAMFGWHEGLGREAVGGGLGRRIGEGRASWQMELAVRRYPNPPLAWPYTSSLGSEPAKILFLSKPF